MKIKNKSIFQLVSPIAISICSIVFPTFTNPILAESTITELENFCSKYKQNLICKNQESYISLETWKKNETTCFLATEWKNEAKKCKVVANDKKLTIYIEDGILSKVLPNTLKTKAMTISLDEIFTFDAQWWLGDIAEVKNTQSTNAASSENYQAPSSEVKTTENSAGIFPELNIGFIAASNSTEDSNGKFLTITSNRLFQIIEEIEAWRYYLPDLITFEQQLKSKANNKDSSTNFSGNIAKLLETNQCFRCDLRNADLAGLDLENANLQGANLSGANLSETKLKQAYLLGANLNKANLVKADLESVNLMFASLIKADLFDAKLKGANLQNTNLSNTNLTEAELNAKAFKATSLKNANLSGAILTNADLRCVDFNSANLKNANLSGADLSECQKSSAVDFTTKLSALGLNGRGVSANIAINVLNNVNNVLNLVGVLAGSQSVTVTTTQLNFTLVSNLRSANLSGANLTDANLSEANLTDTNLSNAILVEPKFSANILSNTNFINTDISEIDFKDPVSICEAIFNDKYIYEEYCQSEE
jgi:uncharacterized protein YjbI with pentapeptide repeats